MTIDATSAVGLAIAFASALVVAALTAPVGVSGAVFLLPVQVSVLSVPSPSVTPTNLLYNVVATPGALLRYRHQGQFDRHLVRLLLAGTVPGVVVGAWIRVTLLPGEAAFRLVLALVLVPIGLWLLASGVRARPEPANVSPRVIVVLSSLVGTIGGIVGIGGGSILAPALAGLGVTMSRVAPAAMLTTFVTSAVGIVAYAALALAGTPAAAPEWLVGVALGVGGLLGGYLGARMQPYIDERILRHALGAIAVLIGISYAISLA